MIPYGHQTIEDDDIAAVVSALKGEWLTQGPQIEAFESALSSYAGARYVVVCNNGTSALHMAYAAAGLGAGDEFITTPLTFFATANAGLWQGSRPVFVDIDSATGSLDPELVETKITSKTKAIVVVDYMGRPAAFDKLRIIAEKHHLVLIEDGAQSLGAEYNGKKIGSISDLTTFSFHPVKTITTGEGGAVLTNDEVKYRFMKKFVTHGLTKEQFFRPSPGPWYMEMAMLGQNYRLTDIQCALGISQLKKVDRFVEKRRLLAERYNEAFANTDLILPPADTTEFKSAWHLYVIRLPERLVDAKSDIVQKLRSDGIWAQVHHIPVHTDPYYTSLGYGLGLCPKAEAWYARALSLPLYPLLSTAEQDHVIAAVKALL
ncbi:MAG: UDP-4-amino-4,6-dideoxy-N-acetyl-beta-L-altrosamine transaminase [Candidatus Magasanikbacteria bacterium]|nr:UDP-4-amino-4,6-dideoxy-N-acetyl-beta-L-altrosamine transaminase [Candidatus Magasanikbacteria bacterium]